MNHICFVPFISLLVYGVSWIFLILYREMNMKYKPCI